MRCNQCPRPAFYEVESVPLCLDCFSKFQSIQNIRFLQNAAMMNQALDDMDFISGIPTGGGRIPVAALAKAMQKNPVYNNINISNSNVGVINTGDLAKIDAVITISEGTDTAIIGQNLKALTQAIVDANSLNEESKKEIVELLQSLSEQIVGSRKKSVVKSLLTSIEQRVSGLNAIFKLAENLKASLGPLFGGEI